MAKGGGDRNNDRFEEVPVANPDLATFPERQGGTAATVRVIPVGSIVDPTTGDVVLDPRAVGLKSRFEEDSVTQDVFYSGKAEMGALTSAAVWQIKRITITEVANITSIDTDWADGNGSFDNIWDNREALSYS